MKYNINKTKLCIKVYFLFQIRIFYIEFKIRLISMKRLAENDDLYYGDRSKINIDLINVIQYSLFWTCIESLMNFVLIGDYLTKNLWSFSYTIFSYSFYFYFFKWYTYYLCTFFLFYYIFCVLNLTFLRFFCLQDIDCFIALFIKIKKNKIKKRELSRKWNWVRIRNMCSRIPSIE